MSNSQINKLKSATKYKPGITLKLSSNMTGNTNNEANFSHSLFLTKRFCQ